MNFTERYMAVMGVDSPHEIFSTPGPEYYMTSQDFFRLIDVDYMMADGDSVLRQEIGVDPWISNWPTDIEYSSDSLVTSPDESSWFLDITRNPGIMDPLESIDEIIMVNPKTGALVTHPFSYTEMTKTQEPQISPKPYPHHDHDYVQTISDENDVLSFKEANCKTNDSEPIVEVWEIEKFKKESPASGPQQSPSYQQKPKEPKRTSLSKEEMKQRIQERKEEMKQRVQERKAALRSARPPCNVRISDAVDRVLNKKPRSSQYLTQKRHYMNIMPKNSVETTPSQSDVEEWCSQPVKPKVTKKKTTKGRIDHSESERHRREVLRRNFSSLSDLIPNDYLRGEKASSQISKQKILNGAKAYILELNSVKCSYKANYNRNLLLREKWHKKSGKLLKCIKKRK